VVRFDRVEGAFGAVGLVTGAFDGELGGPPDPPMPVGDLVGGGQRQIDLVGVQRFQQSFGHRLVHRGGDDGPAGGGGEPGGRGRARRSPSRGAGGGGGES